MEQTNFIAETILVLNNATNLSRIEILLENVHFSYAVCEVNSHLTIFNFSSIVKVGILSCVGFRSLSAVLFLAYSFIPA